MSEIPKRPEPLLSLSGDYLRQLAEHNGAMQAHEHAVAKVAVEALQQLDSYALEINLRHVSDTISEALAKIEASGWQP